MSNPVKKVPIHLQSSQNRLLIKNGKTVDETEIIDQDVYIEDGIIKQLGKNLIIPGGTRVIDARGKYVMPGGIDPHTHFEVEFMGLKSVDDFYQGTKAAIAGGTTMIIDFVLPKKGESLLEKYHEYREKADGKVCCDYALHMIIPEWNEKIAGEMITLCNEYGVNSFKAFMTNIFMLSDSELYSLFETCKKIGAVPLIHAENGAIIAKNVEKLLAKGITGPEGHEMSRPEEVEAEAVNRACVIANQVEAPLYIMHVMSRSATLSLKQARERNSKGIIGETLAASICLDGRECLNSSYQHAAGYITNPPLRSDPSTPLYLMNALAQDDLQITASDNCTFNKSQKEAGLKDFSKIPNGVNGVEDRLSVIWEKGVQTGIIDPCRFVAITSTNAAKVFNLYPAKGCIAVGSDADIIIWNPNRTRLISAKTHHQAVDFNIFEGMTCHGVPEFVIVSGRVCVDEDQLRAVEGHGRYVETPAFPPFLYDSENADKIKPIKNGTIENEEDDMFKSMDKSDGKEPFCCTPTLPESAVTTPSCKGPRPEGQRNIQDTTFSISEDIDVERKSCIRVKNPPGGKSTGFW